MKLKYVNKPDKIGSALKAINKILVIDTNSIEIKNELLGCNTREVKLNGTLIIVDNIRNTHLGFRIKNDYES